MSIYLIISESDFKHLAENSNVGVWLEWISLSLEEFVLELYPMETKRVEEAL